jgi:hypothetical protein
LLTPHQLYANPEDFVPLLRTDPNSKLIVQLLPNDSLAMIPLVQDFEEFEGFDSSSVRYVENLRVGMTLMVG